MNDVSIQHDVLFSFGTELSDFACLYLATRVDVILISDDFGSNEPAFEIGVDLTGALRSAGPSLSCPGMTFLGAYGEESNEI
jgi:hypothetical protein